MGNLTLISMSDESVETGDQSISCYDIREMADDFVYLHQSDDHIVYEIEPEEGP